MTKKFFLNMINGYKKVDYGFMALLCLFVLAKSIALGILAIILMAGVIVFHRMVTMKLVDAHIEEYEKTAAGENDDFMKSIKVHAPLACCAADREGAIIWANNAFSAIFEEDETLKQPGQSFFETFFQEENTKKTITIGTKIFQVTSAELAGDILHQFFFFEDITEVEELRKKYEDDKSCLAIIDIDNYDELMASVAVNEQSAITASIEKRLSTWSQSMYGCLNKVREDRFLLLFTTHYLTKTVRDKFPIIDAIHEIETEADFPTSLSIGVGYGAANFEGLLKNAEDALDLAIGRGGDQAAVKSGRDVQFYGGALPTVEKRNKGKSRIIAHTLIQLINDSERVIVMGHTRPDMDSFGSACGVYNLVKNLEKPVDIVLNHVDDAIELVYNAAVAGGMETFIDSQTALDLVTDQTLVIVVDAHIPYITECPELLTKAKRLVVIDHHRRSALGIENATLTHMEVYASSASELVTEILQYSGDKDDYGKFEVEALLAGMAMDSKNFTSNAGVRTFEAASWLRRAGADVTDVQNFFKLRLDFYKKKVNIIASAEIIGNGIAVAYTKEQDPTMQVLVSQAADELLDMLGVDTAFAAGIGKEKTMISARSRSAVNVQTVMEKLGGGGHQNMAAAQVTCSPEEAIQQVVQILRDENYIE